MKNPEQPEEEDNDPVWLEVIRGVKKIPEKPVVAKKIKVREVSPKVSAADVHVDQFALENLELGNVNNIDRSTASKFRKEKFEVQATLDLHGMTEDKAYDKVINFIKSSYGRGLRAVIIVTGKGLHQSDEDEIFSRRAVLKNKVPEWLNLPEVRPFILSYNHPSPKLGGSGALYILLRRKR